MHWLFFKIASKWSGIAMLAALFLMPLAGHAQDCSADAGPATHTICAGTSLTLNGTGTGVAPIAVSWTGNGAGYLSSTNTLQTVFNHPAPLYVQQVFNLTLSITASDGCTATDNVQITVNAAPAPLMIATPPAQTSLFNGLTTFSICDPAQSYTFNFSDQSTAFAGSTRTIDWGDGSTVFLPAQGWTATHTYPPGLHTVSYSITYPNGCSRTTNYQVFLGTNPGGGISTDPNTNICAGATLPFYINSVAGNSPGTTYLISFGDGTEITLAHPPPAVVNHQYNVSSCGAPGNQYYVQIIAQNPCDATQGQIGPIRVSDPPVAGFNISPNDTACVNTVVSFTDQSIGAQAPQCTPPKRVWSITPATGWTIAAGALGAVNGTPNEPNNWWEGSAVLGVDFNTAGTYVMELVSGNSCGTSVLQRTICIEPTPVPAFTLSPTTGCAPLLSATTNLSQDNGCGTSWQWNVAGSNALCGGILAWYFAGGTSGASFEPQIHFGEAGTYAVQLQAVNSCGTFQQTQNVVVNAPPQVEIAALAGICAGDCVQPSAITQPCGSPITSYAWSFPGGTPATSDQAVPGAVCYDASTNSQISLTVANACGSSTDAITLNVGSLPGSPAVSSNSPVCAGQTLSVSAAAMPGVTYSWTGPNNFSTNQASFTIQNVNANHAGTYTLVVSGNGCAGGSQTVQVQVIPPPIVSVTPPSATICAGESVLLTASGAGNYQWLIANTVVHTGASFLASPAATTTYSVTGSVGNCTGSTAVTVTVNPLPNVSAGGAQTFCDQAIPVQLNGTPAPGTWSGQNVSPNGVFTPVPGSLGVFPVSYTHTNANGCTNTSTVDITVQALTLIADAGPDTTVCQGTVPMMLAASPPGGTWVGAGAGGAFTPSIPGSHLVTYHYGTGTCATSDQVTVTVLASPSIVVPDAFALCADDAAFPLIAAPQGGIWSGPGINGPPWAFDPDGIAPGSHVLTYSFTDGDGCTSTAQTLATVNAMPVAEAGDDLQLCDQPITVQLAGTPAGGTWTANWMDVTPGGGLTPNGLGVDQLTYTFTSAAGCTSSDAVVVEVVEIDEPAYAGADTAVCTYSDVLQLIGTPEGGTWSGPQINADGAFTPSIAGDHVLTYSVGSSTCLVQDQIMVTVNALPVVDAGDDIGVCLDGGPQTLLATPSGGVWSGVGVDPSTGVFDPLAAVEGGNPVTYTYTDPFTGCINSDDALVTVHPLPVASFDHALVACVGVPFAFNNTSTGASAAEWDFGDNGSSSALMPFHTYMEEGEFQVMLVAGTGAGCTDTSYSTVTVWDLPQAVLILDVDSGCGPLMVDLGNGSIGEGLDFQWNFGGIGSSNEEFPAPFSFPSDPYDAITYSVSLTASNACGTSTLTAPVVVMPTPTAILSPDLDLYCSFAEVPIVNASIGLPDEFQWFFGDGAISDSNAPIVTHAYEVIGAPQEFTIVLVASNECGSDTADYTITVLPNEVTAFFNTDPITGCSPLTVEFTQYSVGDTSWYWDLGDGNVSIAQDPTHTFEDAGIYTVELHGYGCGYDSYSMDITVLPSPEPAFTALPATVCVGENITFTNLTPDVAGLHWDFGDGVGSQLSPVQHSYSSAGTYDVALTVTSIFNGCTSVLTQQVTIGTTPVASFTPFPLSGCIDLEVTFQNNSTDASAYQWWFGDGNTSGQQAPVHTYTEAATHTITMVAENLNGCTDTTTAIVVAHPLPVSSFALTGTQSCTSPVTVQTQNNSTGAIGYSWDFDNGTTSLLNQPPITFDAPGTYQVQLTATNQFGCAHTSTQPFIVHPTPLADFTAAPDPGCARQPVAFTNGSQNSSSYQWWFGDGSFSAAEHPLHIFPSPGEYDITLVATGAGGCTDTLIVLAGVHINPTPVAAFESDTLASIRHALRFFNLSDGAERFEWDFGDGEGSTAMHPIHLFPADGGGFTVCLVAVNEFACSDTICHYIMLPGDPEIFVPNAFTPNNDGVNDVFHPILNGFDGWSYRLMIFDRWGVEIHSTNDRHEGWDGRSRGKASPIDVYVWKVVVERNGDARDFIGHVSLVR